MLSTVKERLTQYLKVKKISKSAFGRAIGASSAFVTSIQKTIGAEKIQSIALNYPDLNIEWLLTGEGVMIKTQSGHTVVTGDVSGSGHNIVAGNNNVLRDAESRYVPNPKREDIEVIDGEEIPVKETIVLNAEIVNKEGIDIQKELDAGTLDVLVKPTQDVLPPHELKIYTENDEMAPDIEANDPVFARKIASPKLFKPRYMYFVDLNIGGVVRWVDWDQEKPDHIRLISRKAVDVVPISSVLSMSEIVVITKRPKTLPIDLETTEQKIERKEAQLDRMFDHQSRLIDIIAEQTKR